MYHSGCLSNGSIVRQASEFAAATAAFSSVVRQNRVLEDARALAELRLIDHQRRSQADDIALCRLRLHRASASGSQDSAPLCDPEQPLTQMLAMDRLDLNLVSGKPMTAFAQILAPTSQQYQT